MLEGGASLAAVSGMRQEAGRGLRTRLPLGLVMQRAEALAEAVAALQEERSEIDANSRLMEVQRLG